MPETMLREPSRVPVSAFVDRELREALAERARDEDRSVSAVIRLALVRYLDELASTARREQMLEDGRTLRAGISAHRKLDIETMEGR